MSIGVNKMKDKTHQYNPVYTGASEGPTLQQMGNTIDVTNNTDCVIKVIVSPTPGWKIADLLRGAQSIYTSHGTINTIQDLWKVWNEVVAIGDRDSLSDLSIKVKNLFDQYGMPVNSGLMCNMYDAAVFEALDSISPVAMEAFRGAFEVTMTMLMEERNGRLKLVQYKSMTDYSWIVHSKYVTRIKHGTLWEDGINLKEFKPVE